MTQKDIISGSKLIAEYLGWKYIPHNDLQGFPKAGWFIVRDNQRMMLAKYDGWVKVEDKAVKFVCRNHSELRFWNSIDVLVPVIQKIEKEFEDVKFYLHSKGCSIISDTAYKEFDDLPNWSNNVFSVVVSFLREKR